jgi:hypothetical protein
LFDIKIACERNLQQQQQQTRMNETMDVSTTGDDEDDVAYRQMHAFMAYLPDELTASYREACRFVPELIEKESNPKWFLK